MYLVFFLDGAAVKQDSEGGVHPSAFPAYAIRLLTLRTKCILSIFRLRWKVTSLVDFELLFYSIANQ